MARDRSTLLLGGLIILGLGSILVLVPLALRATPDIGNGGFPADWFAPGTDEEQSAQAKLVGQPMPPLDLTQWRNGELKPEDLKGKIVVLDFWATWCAPCLAAFPDNNKLYATYKPRGVEFIGICTNSGQENFEKILTSKKPGYPTARDEKQATMSAWSALTYPTYAVVDRRGVLRAIGLKHEAIEKVVLKLLSEPAI